MPVPLGAQPSPDFNQPLALLSDCHRRIEKFLRILLVIAKHATAAGGPLSAEHRHALQAALTYFATAAPRHTEDEERSLFPRMRQQNDPRVHPALASLERLEADHRTADAGHQEVDALGNRWLRDGQLPAADLHRLLELLEQLQSMYQRHIELEDSEVFPLARSVLPQEAVRALGLEMAHRRGVRVNDDGTSIPLGAAERSR